MDELQLPDLAPVETRSLWGDLFGIGPLIKMATDPAMIAQVMTLMATMTENARAAQRIEMKLDLILSSQGHDIDALNRQASGLDARPEPAAGNAAAVLEHHRDAGNGSAAAASRAAHHGGSSATRPHR